MWKLIVVSFIALGFAFYELSGGQDFDPSSSVDNMQMSQVREEAVAQTVSGTALGGEAVANVTQDSALVEKQEFAALEAPEVRSDASVLESSLWTLPENMETTLIDVAEAEITPVVLPQEDASEAEQDVRRVAVNRANFRNGPGTSFGIIGKLPRDAELVVLQEPGNGWLKLRSVDDNKVGWLAASLVK